MNDMIGYNVENIEALRDVINTMAQDVATDVPEVLVRYLVKPMSKLWFSEEAVTFFGDLKITVESAGKIIQEAFDGFRLAVQDAGKNWAENTGSSEVPELGELDEVSVVLEVKDIKNKDENKNVGIHFDEAIRISKEVGQAYDEIRHRMSVKAIRLNSSTAFIGGNQSQAIGECFSKVSESIAKIFEFINTQLPIALANAANKYRNVAEGISSAFTSSGMTEGSSEGFGRAGVDQLK